MITLPFRRALLWILPVGLSAVASVTSAEDSSTSVPPPPRRIVRSNPLTPTPEKGAAPSPEIPESPSPESNPWLAPTKIDFPGGTVADFAKQFEPLPAGISRIELGDYRDSILPPLKLRGKPPLESILGIMGGITGGQFSARMRRVQSSVDGETELVLGFNYSSTHSPPSEQYIPEFDFPGGTVQQLADAIRKEDWGITNIHIATSLAAEPIPAFKVRTIRFGDLMNIIQRISDGRCRMDLTGTFLEIGYKADPNSTTATATAIYPLRELLKTYRIEDINALVQTALKMRNTRIGTDEKDPDMSLHKETSTLVVVGSADQVKVVKDVLAALQDQPGDAKAPSSSPAKDAP